MNQSETIKAITDILTLVLGVGGAWWAYRKFKQEKRKEREDRARTRFAEYLQDARRCVRFMDEYWPPNEGTPRRDKVAYRLFISRVMWACEEVLLAFDSADWKECVNETVEYHAAYFATPEFQRHMKTLDCKLQRHLAANGFVPADWVAAECC